MRGGQNPHSLESSQPAVEGGCLAFAFDLQIFADPNPKTWVNGTKLTLGDEVHSMSVGDQFILQDGSGNEYATLKRVDEDDYKYRLKLAPAHISALKNIDLRAAGAANVLVQIEGIQDPNNDAYGALGKVVFTFAGGSLKGVGGGIILGTTLKGELGTTLTLLQGNFELDFEARKSTIKIETTDAVTLAWKTAHSYSEPNQQVRVEALGGGSPAKATYTYNCFTQPNENAKITVEKASTDGEPSYQDFVNKVGSTSPVFVAYEGAVIKGDGSGNAIPCGGTFQRSGGGIAYGQVIQVAATEADVVFRGVRYQWNGSQWDRYNCEDRVIFRKGAEGTIQNLSESYSKPLEITLKKGSISTGMAAGIAENPESETADNTIRITLANGGAILAENGDFDVSSGGLVSGMDTGETLSIGTETYRAAADGTKIQYMAKNLGSLQAGAVDLQKGGSIYIGGAGCKVTLAEGEADCTVAANGSITGLSEGNRLVLEQDGETYEGIVSEGKFSVTKDGVTKSCSLSDEGSIAEGALEKVLDEMVEELYALDPSKPQTIRTTPGQTKTPEAYNPKKDTIRISQASGALEADKLILTEDGLLTYGDSFAQGLAENGAVDLSKGEQGKSYYTARLTDKDGKNPQLAAWSGTRSATVDMRQETKGVIMKDGGNGKKDTFLGGKGKDDITLGAEDVAAGGKGNDNITMDKDASGAAVAIKNGDDHDKVTDFSFGFGEEANSVSLPGGMNQAGIDSRGRLKVGTATLEFAGTDLKTSGQTDLLLKDSHGTHKAAVGTSLKAEGELADIYYGTGKEAEADFSNSGESDLVIDLNNSSSYGKTTASVYNVQKVKGSDTADNTMVGQDGKNNTLIAGDGGSNRLYGGKGGRDHLVGSSTSEDTFYFGADSGRDEIENFGEEDVLGLLGGSLSQASFDAGGRLKLNWQDTNGNSSCLLFAEDMKDKVITYDLGNGAHGAKFGEKLTVADDTADLVDYYSSGSKAGDGELDISGGSDKKIWLDGSHGAVFDGFNKIDATAATGDMELAGGDKGDSILGGQGESSLWGGSGGNDYLTGGSGYNEFYFGRGEGHDVITDSNNGDKVMLYNVALEDIDPARTGMDASGNMVIRLQDGSSLTIRNYGAQGATTFQLSDSTWNYDRASGAWSQE